MNHFELAVQRPTAYGGGCFRFVPPAKLMEAK